MRIQDMSPDEAAKLVARYLRDVDPTTRKRFIDAAQPTLDEYARYDPNVEVKLYYPIIMTYECEDCGYKVENRIEAVDAQNNLRIFINHKHLKSDDIKDA